MTETIAEPEMSPSPKTCAFGDWICKSETTRSDDGVPCTECRQMHTLIVEDHIEKNPPPNEENARSAVKWIQDSRAKTAQDQNKHVCVTEDPDYVFGEIWRAAFFKAKIADFCSPARKRTSLCRRCRDTLEGEDGYKAAFHPSGTIKFLCVMKDPDFDDIPEAQVARKRRPKGGKECKDGGLVKGGLCAGCSIALDVRSGSEDHMDLFKFIEGCEGWVKLRMGRTLEHHFP